jgi:hypothetical protein
MYKGKSGGSMSSVKGLCSTKKNPMSAPRQVKPMCGPGGNADAAKANKLLQKAQMKEDSLRGMSGM